MINKGRACHHLGCEIFCNLKSCKPAPPLSPGKGEEKTCPFWAAPGNSANVGGRSCASSQIGGHRFETYLVCACSQQAAWSKFQDGNLVGWQAAGPTAGRPDWPDNGPSVRPAPLLSSCSRLRTFIWTCFYLYEPGHNFLFLSMFSVCFLFRIRVTSSLNIILFP